MAINVTSILLSLMVLVGVGVAWARGGTEGDFSGDGNGTPVMVEVAAGQSLSDLADELDAKGVVGSPGAFVNAANAHPRSNSLQPGFYRLEERMSAESAVEALLNPENQAGMIDIPTGLRLEDTHVVASDDVRKGIFTLISEASCAGGGEDCVSVEDLRAAAGTTPPAELGVPAWAVDAVNARGDDPKRIEGLITPGIHHFDPSGDAVAVLKGLLAESAQQFESTGLEATAMAVGLTPYELVTAASLVEAEAPADDFDKVARVILNRLEINQPLEFDSTVNYDLPDQEVATTDEARARETPWNTYRMYGLPATPIGAPSLKAIEAMENPAPGEWLYFVTVDSEGTTIFSNTLEEHQAATQQAIDGGVLDSNR
ncbi:endolytic transglycosylase MltG [Corynebacterium sp. 335C]